MDVKRKSHEVYELGYHLIWCTKYRHPILVDAVEIEARHILAQTCTVYGWELHAIEIMPDHVHMFVGTDPQTSPAEVAKTLKSISAVKIFTAFPKRKGQKFWGNGLWSPSTYFGSVGHVSEETVRKYIETQKQRG